jgi:TonB family protein
MDLKSIRRLFPAASVCLLSLSILFAQSPAHNSQTNKSEQANGDKVFTGKEVETKAFLVKRVEPKYTKDAKKHKTTGTVIMRCIFSSTGKVTDIRVISGLPDGLTEKAVEAARQIKFKPATKNGKPVSMYMQLEYNFNLR